MDLTINAGAYTGTFKFGSVSLTNLTIKTAPRERKAILLAS